MARLFGRNALAERAQQIKTEDILDHVALVQTWLDDYDTGTLKKDKETSREQQYNYDFFVKILGYVSKPASPYTFDPKDTTEKKQYPDAVLRYTELGDSKIDNVSAVVELKGASINLDKPQQREGNLSPVQQAFKYKPQYRVCPFVIVSNFFEFRLYNDNQLDYERWTLRELVDPADDYLAFKQWYYLLHSDRLVSKEGKSETERFLSDVREEQIAVGEKFYAEYRQVRLELLRDIWKRNPDSRSNFQRTIKKAQTIVDRFVFACFAEDSGLLPDDTLSRTLQYAQNSPHQTIWEAFKAFFHSVSTGSAKLGIPNGYEGALFEDDDELNSLDIGDEPLVELAKLGGKYDFEEKITVKVLGHVFEQSITDLEEIKRQIELDQDPLGIEADSPKGGKRKKDGIYYTPDHVVRYIVENTVGAYLRDTEERLKKKHNLSGMKTDEGYEKREKTMYLEYLHKLQKIRVLDPACGSGAFLVGVFDYLLAENLRVDDILGGTYTSYEDSVRIILSDNIFGVDLNEESVEITKLSIWLKTAERGKPLASLDKNIKCGNSLVHDPKIAGLKAFDWDHEFGGTAEFHVVLGNPPYVDSESMVLNSPAEREWIANHYSCAAGNWDLFVPFTQKAISLLAGDPSARFGFIIPNKVLGADYAKTLRKHVDDEYSVTSIVDISREKVFIDADVYPVVLTVAKGAAPERENQGVVSVFRSLDPLIEEKVQFDAGYTSNWTEYLATDRKLLDALRKLPRLGASLEVHASTTVNEAYLLVDDVEVNEHVPAGSLKIINTGTIDRYICSWDFKDMRYIKKNYRFPTVKLGKAPKKPWLEHPRIILAGMASIVEAFPDPDKEYFAAVSTVVVTTDDIDQLYYATAILNSSVITEYFKELYKSEAMAGGYINVKPNGIRDLPFVPYNPRSHRHKSLVKLARQLRKAMDEQQKFIVAANKFLHDMYGLKPGRSGDLIGLGFQAVRKKIRGLSVKGAAELHEWFSEKEVDHSKLRADVDLLDREVSDLVSAIFGVSELMMAKEAVAAAE